MCCWTSFAALAGGCSPHRPSISLSIETVWLASRASIARTARCLAARSATGRSATLASTGPSTRISIGLTATLRLADCAPQGQLPAANRRATAGLPARRRVVTTTDRTTKEVVMPHTTRHLALAAAATALLALAPSAPAAQRAPHPRPFNHPSAVAAQPGPLTGTHAQTPSDINRAGDANVGAYTPGAIPAVSYPSDGAYTPGAIPAVSYP